MNLGWPEITIIVVVVFLLFGPKRLPDLARSVGEGIREFKKSVNVAAEETTKASSSTDTNSESSGKGA